MIRALHLTHHRHTGRLIHHRHTSYRSLLVIALLVGIVMLLTTRAAAAYEFNVTAIVPAPMPDGVPTITSPKNNDIIYGSAVTVTGTCPVITPVIFIIMSNNNEPAGSVECRDDGSYELPVALHDGENALVATVHTFTGQDGKSSGSIVVKSTPGTPPAQSAPVPPPINAPNPAIAPLAISTTNYLISFSPQLDAKWIGTITGGLPPYAVTVNWGDGSSLDRTTQSDETLSISHHYGDYSSHSVRVEVSDQSGQHTFFVIQATSISYRPQTGTGTTKPTNPSQLPTFLTGTSGIVISFAALATVIAGLIAAERTLAHSLGAIIASLHWPHR